METKNLMAAMEYAKINSVRKAAALFGIARKTLEYRIKKNDNSAPSHMGPSSVFGLENEKKIVNHVKKCKKVDFQ